MSSKVLMLFIYCLVLLGGGCSKKEERMNIAIPEIKSLTIYSFKNPFDPKNINSTNLNQSVVKIIQDPELQILFQKALHKKKKPLWKTAIAATIDYVDGNRLFITISSYGSFFVVVGQEGYFYFEDENLVRKWNFLVFGNNK